MTAEWQKKAGFDGESDKPAGFARRYKRKPDGKMKKNLRISKFVIQYETDSVRKMQRKKGYII